MTNVAAPADNCGDPVLPGEASHAAVQQTSTWCKLGKQIPTVHVSHSQGGISGAHTFTCETLYSFLWGTSPVPLLIYNYRIFHEKSVLFDNLPKCRMVWIYFCTIMH